MYLINRSTHRSSKEVGVGKGEPNDELLAPRSRVGGDLGELSGSVESLADRKFARRSAYMCV